MVYSRHTNTLAARSTPSATPAASLRRLLAGLVALAARLSLLKARVADTDGDSVPEVRDCGAVLGARATEDHAAVAAVVAALEEGEVGAAGVARRGRLVVLPRRAERHVGRGGTCAGVGGTAE